MSGDIAPVRMQALTPGFTDAVSAFLGICNTGASSSSELLQAR